MFQGPTSVFFGLFVGLFKSTYIPTLVLIHLDGWRDACWDYRDPEALDVKDLIN